MSKIYPKIDLVFKKLFGSEENNNILLHLINAILPLHQQVAKITLKNPYNVSDYAEDKLSSLDIKAQGEDDRLFDPREEISLLKKSCKKSAKKSVILLNFANIASHSLHKAKAQQETCTVPFFLTDKNYTLSKVIFGLHVK